MWKSQVENINAKEVGRNLIGCRKQQVALGEQENSEGRVKGAIDGREAGQIIQDLADPCKEC